MIRIFHSYVSPKSIVLFVVESILIIATLILGAKIRFRSDPFEFVLFMNMPYFAVQTAIRLVVFQICFLYGDLYSPQTSTNHNERLISLGRSLGSASLVLGGIYFVLPELLIGRGVFVISPLILAVSIVVLRGVLKPVWRATERAESAGIEKESIRCQLQSRFC